jgi:cysteine-rich repeat protein
MADKSLRIPLLSLLGFMGVALTPAGARAACTVNIVDGSPLTGATKNVGQEVTLSAVLLGGPFANITYDWSVEGEVVDDYNDQDPAAFSVTDHIEIAGPVAKFSTQMVRFYWREQTLALPTSRTVTVDVVADGMPCSDSTAFTVERNSVSTSRQAEDFYTSNHTKRVLIDHQNWHISHAVGTAGEEFFCFHRRLVERFNGWRVEFGYPAVGQYDPKDPIPAAEGGYPLGHPRVNSSPNVDRSVLYPWITLAGSGTPIQSPPWCFNGSAANTKKLADFPTLEQLGCVVEGTFHNQVHGDIGGSMSSIGTAPQDPIFWRWHNFLSNLAFNEWMSTVPAGQTMVACALPPRESSPCGVDSVTLTYDADYAGYVGYPDPGKGYPKPKDVSINGKKARNVVVNGSGVDTTYTYSGYESPGPGVVVVAVKDRRYRYGANTSYTRGQTYSYTNYAPSPAYDADGDGVYDGPCWPQASYDNCPDVYNPDQYDSDSYYTSTYHRGDACETYTCGNGITELGEVCDDGNVLSGDGCRQDCRSDESCGNGEVDIGEQCDDGNSNNFDRCKNDCTYNSCGDGYASESQYGRYFYAREMCDDGNYDYGDGCSPDCCEEYSSGDYGAGGPEAGVDCYMRGIETDLQYARYDLKLVRQIEKKMAGARKRLGVIPGGQCKNFRNVAGKMRGLQKKLGKLVTKGVLPSEAYGIMSPKLAALLDWLDGDYSLFSPNCSS